MADLTRRAPAQQKQVTLLAATLPASTLLPESASQTLLACLSESAQRYEGSVQPLGAEGESRVVALFGVPTAREDDPIRAIRAALELQAEVAALPLFASHPELRPQVGINTGLVQLSPEGIVLSSEALEIARRMSQRAPAGGVLISHESYRHIKERFDLQPWEPIASEEKGLPLYLVQGERPRTFRLYQGIEGIDTGMVGREAEFGTLQRLFQEVSQDNQLRIVTIQGEAGIGKSRLLYEFNRWVEEQPTAVRFFKGRAGPQVSRQPYGLLRDLFIFRFGILGSDRAPMARAKLEQGIRQFMGTEATEKTHILAQLLGFDFSESPYVKRLLKEPQKLQEHAFRYARDFFVQITTPRASASRWLPAQAGSGERSFVMIFLEDLHWSDEGSLKLVEYLIQECTDIPMLLVSTARPILWERHPTWSQVLPADRHTLLEIQTLSAQESRGLVTALLGRAESVPAELETLLVERADGNPFYTEELVKMLVEEGVIVSTPGGAPWRVLPERLAATRVPTTITGVIQARLDTLAEAERELLQQAAVVGRVFWDHALTHLPPLSEPDSGIQGTLQALRAKELILERHASAFAGAREFAFRHATTQEVAYHLIPLLQRRAWHRGVAEWHEQQPDSGPSSYALLAHHWEQAAAPSRALHYHILAGEAAAALYANAEAMTHYGHALTLAEQLDALPEQAHCQLALGSVLERSADFQVAIHWLERARLTYDSLQDKNGVSQSLVQLGCIFQRQGEYEQAREHLEKGLSLANEAENRYGVLAALYMLGVVAQNRNDRESARRYLEESLALARELDDRRGIARALSFLGAVVLNPEQPRLARQYLEEGLLLRREMGDKREIANAHGNLGYLLYAQGEFAAAREHLEACLRTSQELDDRLYLAYMFVALAAISLQEKADDLERARGVAWLSAVVAKLLTAMGAALETYEQGIYERSLRAAQAALGQERFQAAWAEGEAMPLHSAIEYALEPSA